MIAFLATQLLAEPADTAQWPQWRGPDGTSPALAGDQIFLRGHQSLYCIASPWLNAGRV